MRKEFTITVSVFKNLALKICNGLLIGATISSTMSLRSKITCNAGSLSGNISPITGQGPIFMCIAIYSVAGCESVVWLKGD